MKKKPEDLAEKTRRDMLRRAIARPPFNGNQAEFARQANKPASQINALNPPRQPTRTTTCTPFGNQVRCTTF